MLTRCMLCSIDTPEYHMQPTALHGRTGIVILLWGEALRPPPNPPLPLFYFNPSLHMCKYTTLPTSVIFNICIYIYSHVHLFRFIYTRCILCSMNAHPAHHVKSMNTMEKSMKTMAKSVKTTERWMKYSCIFTYIHEHVVSLHEP